MPRIAEARGEQLQLCNCVQYKVARPTSVPYQLSCRTGRTFEEGPLLFFFARIGDAPMCKLMRPVHIVDVLEYLEIMDDDTVNSQIAL